MTNTMRAFLTEWLAMAEANADNTDTIHMNYGLCENALVYGGPRLRSELKLMFSFDGLNPLFPFGRSAYLKYQSGVGLHKQPARLKWVLEKLSK